MQISYVRFESLVRYMGWKLKSPIMGHGGEVVVHFKNGDETFRGGKLKVTLGWKSGRRGDIIIKNRDPVIEEEIEIPSMKPYQTEKFKIPVRQLPFTIELLNIMDIDCQIINNDGKILVSNTTSLFLTDEYSAKTRAQNNALLFIAILTLLGVVASIILEVV